MRKIRGGQLKTKFRIIMPMGLALACASLALAACGSSSNGAASSGGTASASASPGVDVATKTITIGVSGAKTGPYAVYGGGIPAASAEVADINAHGGINGWKIRYVALDDQYLPAMAIADAKELVNSYHIFADVGMVGTPNGFGILPYLASQNVPDIGFTGETGAIASNTAFKKSPFFGIQMPYGGISTFDVNWLKSQGVSNLSLVSDPGAISTAVLPGVQYATKKDGINLLSTSVIPSATTDFSGYAAKLKAANAPWVFSFLAPPSLTGLIKTCASIGYTPHWLGQFFDLVPSLFKILGPQLSNGLTFESWMAPIGTPKTAAMLSAFKKYSSIQSPGAINELGWIGMGTFVHALRVATAGNKIPTRAAIVAALQSGKSFQPGHVGFTLSFSSTVRVPTGTDSIYRYNNGGLTRIYGPKAVPHVPLSVLK